MLMTYKKSNVKELLPRYIEYAKKLRLVDTFWEDYIVDADIYEIMHNDKSIGFFSVYEPEKLLTSFHIDCEGEMEYIKASQTIFSAILDKFGVSSAFVVTNDEPLLSLCLDFQRTFDTTQVTESYPPAVEMQAYFFDYNADADIREPEFDKAMLRIADSSDLDELKQLDFFDNLDLNDPTDVKYVLRDDNGELLGAGHIQTMVFAPWWGACGMVVAEKHRQRGVGRSIIMHLKDIVLTKGLIPIAGCWYHNYKSRHTLESSGFTSKTRFLRIHFK